MNQELPKARMATLSAMRPLLERYLDPIPSADTLRTWFDAAGVQRLKANPSARRGGGPAWYAVDDVEKFLRQRGSLRGNLPPMTKAKGSARIPADTQPGVSAD